MNNSGKVFLVGAGPGDIGLLTLKGWDVLKHADVVVYDNLVGDEVLAAIPKSARAVNVGKRMNHHNMPQEEINEILVREAKNGSRVVRLKGGDPFIFGRGGEEAEALAREKIPYEIVPGVTSAAAVPAYAGIPVTHRDFASSLHIVTGHRRSGGEYDIDFKALVRAGGTIVFLMGVTALGDLMKGLIEGGADPDLPASAIQKGTTAAQKSVTATVSTLEDEVKRQGITAPAVIVVGQVCGLAEILSWRGRLPLAGRKIVITRPADRISETAKKLRRKGAEVLELPAISTQAIKNNEKLDLCIENLNKYNWIVFTSPAGVRIFFEKMLEHGKDARGLSGIKTAAIGRGSAGSLKKHGIIADLVPETYDGESLGNALAEKVQENAKILIPRSAIGNKDIIKALEVRPDVMIDDIAVYDTFYVNQDILDERRKFEAGEIDCAVFTSASTVKGFVNSVKSLDYTKITAVCIGRQTKEQAEKYGMKAYAAKEAAMDSVVDKVVEIFGNRNY